MVKCDICGRQFVNEQGVKVHKKLVHTGIETARQLEFNQLILDGMQKLASRMDEMYKSYWQLHGHVRDIVEMEGKLINIVNSNELESIQRDKHLVAEVNKSIHDGFHSISLYERAKK